MRTHFTIQVPRSPDLERQLDKLTAKLERLLWVYPPELVRLHGRMLYKNGREGTICSLDLHLPTAQLNAEEAAATSQAALHAAAEELEEQLKKHRQRLSEQRRRSAPVPDETPRGEAARRDLGEFIGAEMPRLQAFVARRLEAWESDGQMAAGSVDAREVLDEVVVEALSTTPREAVPRRERWFRLLAERAIRRLVRANHPPQDGRQVVSLEQALRPEHGPGDDGERLAPEESLSAAAPTPEFITYTDEIIAALTAAARRLPREQRHDLLLWLIEGFTAPEVAALSQRPLAEVEASLATARRQVGSEVGGLPSELRGRLA